MCIVLLGYTWFLGLSAHLWPRAPHSSALSHTWPTWPNDRWEVEVMQGNMAPPIRPAPRMLGAGWVVVWYTWFLG